jgi:putative ABC transport system permease protein
MQQIVAESMAQPRFSAFVLLLFSAVALLLAGIGIYGVISFLVAQQTREIGIRLAIGARPRDELRRVVLGGVRLVGAGVAIGLVAAFACTRLLRNLLFEVRPSDPLTLFATVLFLTVVGLLACAVPARRASRVDPVHALRYE